jgi:hypothetical protein
MRMFERASNAWSSSGLPRKGLSMTIPDWEKYIARQQKRAVMTLEPLRDGSWQLDLTKSCSWSTRWQHSASWRLQKECS